MTLQIANAKLAGVNLVGSASEISGGVTLIEQPAVARQATIHRKHPQSRQ
jgi:hypothetical protein